MAIKTTFFILAVVFGIGGIAYLMFAPTTEPENVKKNTTTFSGFPTVGEQLPRIESRGTQFPLTSDYGSQREFNPSFDVSTDIQYSPEIKIFTPTPSGSISDKQITPKSSRDVLLTPSSRISSFLESFKRIFSSDFGAIEPDTVTTEAPSEVPSLENGFYSPVLKNYYDALLGAKLIGPGEFTKLRSNVDTEVFFLKVLDYEFSKGNMSTSTLEVKKKFLRDTYAAIANRTFGKQ